MNSSVDTNIKLQTYIDVIGSNWTTYSVLKNKETCGNAKGESNTDYQVLRSCLIV